MIGFDTGEAVVDAGFEVVESFVVDIVKTFLLHKFPNVQSDSGSVNSSEETAT